MSPDQSSLHVAVELLDPDVISETLSLGANGSVLERCWQMEIYRACSSVLPHETIMSPDVGQVRIVIMWMKCKI